MARVKRGVTQRRRHKRLLKEAKGYKWRRKNVYRLAKEAVWHAGQKAYDDRRKKKGDFRRLWQIRINAATRLRDLSYSKFISGLKKANIEIDRKMLSELAIEEPKVFDALVEAAKSNL